MKWILPKPIVIIWVIALSLSYNAFGQSRLNLNDGWKFRKANSNDPWLKANVPGTVISDLEQNGTIDNPFNSCNHENLKWIDETEWEYSLDFVMPSYFSESNELELVFEGLDTYAEVFLNEKQILVAYNMFRKWKVDVTKSIAIGKNSIRVVFHPVSKLIDKERVSVGVELPGGEWAYARKAAFQFGWDFAPRLVNCGIWHPIYLQTVYETTLKTASVTTKSIDVNEAKLAVLYTIQSKNEKEGTLKIVNAVDWQTLHEEKVDIKTGLNNFDINYTIAKPLLWWPNGMGPQNLYSLALVLETETEPQQIVARKVGLRTIELVNEPDKIGTSFYFKVNGKPLFAKGANVVPPHSYKFFDNKMWETLAIDAKLSNMNMLRVWGGGIYPPESFFNACDSLGILVWQDFMFACSMYPWSENYTENVRTEAVQQVNRIKNHTSLALWCGNNEVDEGWHNWGWQNSFSDDSLTMVKVWEGYQKVFHNVLAEVVRENDPVRAYWPSSPQHGWGKEESLRHGDSHYWGVWWGNEPFKTYTEKVPRFMSEFGFQGFPSMATLKQFTNGSTLPDSAQLKCHQKHPKGFQTINKFIESEGFKSKNQEEFTYFSQVLQAQAYQIAIEAHRLAAPNCMGSLYWQLNDCWPAVSWSGIDFLGNWKAMQYQVKHSFSPILVVPKFVKSRLTVNIKSDLPFTVEGELVVSVFTIEGQRLGIWKEYILNVDNNPKQVFAMDLTDGEKLDMQLIAHVEFTPSKMQSFTNCIVNTACSKIKLTENPEIDFKTLKVNEATYIELQVKHPAFYVEVFNAEGNLKLDNNFLHLIPGKKYSIKVLEGDLKGLGVKSMWNYLKGR